MRRSRIAIAGMLAAGIACPLAVPAAPAVAMPAGGNAKPRVLSAAVAKDGRAVTVSVVGRDRDDVVRGAEISWGDGQPAQGLTACSLTSAERSDGRVGRRARFELSYTYPAAGHHTIEVRVLSGGCGRRAQQRSAVRELVVHVD
jgi:hypothetical protein